VGVACASAIPAPPTAPAARRALTAVRSFHLGFIMGPSLRCCQPVRTEDPTVPTGRWAFPNSAEGRHQVDERHGRSHCPGINCMRTGHSARSLITAGRRARHGRQANTSRNESPPDFLQSSDYLASR